MRRCFTILALFIFAIGVAFGKDSRVEVSYYDSWDFYTQTIILDWSSGTLRWSALLNGEEVVAPSRLTMTTTRGVWGEDVADACIHKFEYDDYNSAIVDFGEYRVELRAYDKGVAYRFISECKGRYTIVDELAEFSFSESDMAWIPYVNHRADATSDYATQFETSFENVYTHTAIGNIDWRRLIFAPIVVEHGGVKAWISEANLEDYPGMFLSNHDKDGTLDTEFAPVPDAVAQGGHNMLQGIVKSRKPYIAKCRGERNFPWRIVALAEEDYLLAQNNLVWRLADECRIEDTSWIKPGKVAWEWWNDWGLEGVGFTPGVNNQTYKYYIDFASRYGIEYVILDEGWSLMGEADLMKVVPEIDIKELVDYAAERNVGIILWAGYWALNRDIEGLCKHYSKMGVKGFKVDFLDRDDQQMVRFVYDVAKIAAKYKLLVDYHGIYKPTGLNKTYPNAINFEGVHGLETMKWLGAEHDQLTYDVTIPFIRNVAGPVDYTPGAMRNASRADYTPNYSRPMSQGTRCHQLAMYVLYNQPLAMLCDSPTEYEKEPEFTQFLAETPTTWLSHRISGGAIGEYAEVFAVSGYDTERCISEWYIAGINGDKERTERVGAPVEFGVKSVEIFIDGDNASVDGTDYKHFIVEVEEYSDFYMDVTMPPGGGFVMKFRGYNYGY